jgi:hypothetical protein
MNTQKILSSLRKRPRRTALVAVAVPLVAVAAAVAGTTASAAHDAPYLAVSAKAAAQRPAPYIHDFARGLKNKPLRNGTGPHHVAVAWNVDGCDHDYGTVNQCVPWTIPAPAGQRCQWLAAQGFGPVKVYGRDRQHLDTNHDGIACDAGDNGVA